MVRIFMGTMGTINVAVEGQGGVWRHAKLYVMEVLLYFAVVPARKCIERDIQHLIFDMS